MPTRYYFALLFLVQSLQKILRLVVKPAKSSTSSKFHSFLGTPPWAPREPYVGANKLGMCKLHN